MFLFAPSLTFSVYGRFNSPLLDYRLKSTAVILGHRLRIYVVNCGAMRKYPLTRTSRLDTN